MATPPGNLFSGWKLTPRTDLGKKTVSKGKDVAFTGSGQKGFLSRHNYDDTTVEKQVLIDKAAKLENELVDYQYNMGLLLIEKKEWSSKFEEIKQALDTAKEDFKRQQAAHLITLSEVEKREENLRKALGVERQCVLNLEKTLHEMRSEYAETKYTADSKLSEANALAASIEEKSLEVESKLHAADAKMAEASRKSSEVERKLHEIEAQENALRRDRSSFNNEREAHESALSKHREELREWESKVKEQEDRLADARDLLNKREQRANENDRMLTQKQNDLEDEQRKIHAANSVLRKKEDDITSRLASLALQEKELEDVRKRLEIKEKELDELQEKLNAKEREEIQKLLDEHRAILQTKEEEFELEIRQRRASLDEELRSKVIELEKKEAEVNHAEEKLKKRELALEKKTDKAKEKEKDLDSKLKALKEREKSLKLSEKELEAEKKWLSSEKESLLALKVELEKERFELDKKLVEINEEMERVKITEDEKLEYLRVQLELKQETEKCRVLREVLVKEAEDLKQEKERFEKEWEELDVKRAEIKEELEEVENFKKNYEKVRNAEDERLKKEREETESYVKRKMEALKATQETFAATMEHEKSVLSEKFKSEKIQMVHDFERRKGEVESEMQRKQDALESALHEREKMFEEEMERERSNVEYVKEVARREKEELKEERERFEREKKEVSGNKKHLEQQQLDMKKEIEMLLGLSEKLKDQREGFVKERERFIAFVKKQETCSSCGEGIRLFELSGMKNIEATPLHPHITAKEASGKEGTNDELVSPDRARTMSFIRDCAWKLLKFSPGKKVELPEPSQDPAGGSSPAPSDKEDQLDRAVSISETLDDPRLERDNNIVREVEEAGNDTREEDTQHSGRKERRPVRKGRGKNSRTGPAKAKASVKETENNKQLHINGGSENVNEESQKESSFLGGVNTRKRGRPGMSQGTAAGEFDGSYSDGQSDSVTASSQRKRRQKAAPAVQIPGGRYNLRRPKSATAATANGSLSEPVSKSQGENKKKHSKAAPEVTPIVEVSAGDNGEPGNSGTGLPTDPDNPQLKDAAAENQESNAADIANELVDDTGLSEEVNGTPERPTATHSAYSDGPTVQEEGDDEDGEDGDEEEVEHPGEASIGKKIWTFITT